MGEVGDSKWNERYEAMSDAVDKHVEDNRTCTPDDGNWSADYQNLVRYSAYPDLADDPRSSDYGLMGLSAIAAEGRIQFESDYDDFWGPGESYKSEPIDNPTWLDVCLLANDMINTTGDKHHIFLEAIHKVDTFSVDEGGFIKVYRFSMGS